MTLRWVALALLLSCARQPEPQPTEQPAKQPAAQQTSSAETADCEPRMYEDIPGKHDRFRFEAEDGQVGFKDAAGEVVIEPRFDFAYEFSSEGIAGVADEHGFAFIDPQGSVVARAFAFDNGPDYFVEGRARIVEDGKVGFIGEDGVVAISPRFDHAGSFCEGLAPFCEGCRSVPDGEHSRIEGGLWGYVGPTGTVVIPPRFEWADPFSGGTARVVEGGRELVIDREGRVVARALVSRRWPRPAPTRRPR